SMECVTVGGVLIMPVRRERRLLGESLGHLKCALSIRQLRPARPPAACFNPRKLAEFPSKKVKESPRAWPWGFHSGRRLAFEERKRVRALSGSWAAPPRLGTHWFHLQGR